MRTKFYLGVLIATFLVSIGHAASVNVLVMQVDGGPLALERDDDLQHAFAGRIEATFRSDLLSEDLKRAHLDRFDVFSETDLKARDNSGYYASPLSRAGALAYARSFDYPSIDVLVVFSISVVFRRQALTGLPEIGGYLTASALNAKDGRSLGDVRLDLPVSGVARPECDPLTIADEIDEVCANQLIFSSFEVYSSEASLMLSKKILQAVEDDRNPATQSVGNSQGTQSDVSCSDPLSFFSVSFKNLSQKTILVAEQKINQFPCTDKLELVSSSLLQSKYQYTAAMPAARVVRNFTLMCELYGIRARVELVRNQITVEGY